MSFQWSISTDRLFRRCQRQFFFREIAANHASKDWRREAFILKQLKTLEALARDAYSRGHPALCGSRAEEGGASQLE